MEVYHLIVIQRKHLLMQIVLYFTKGVECAECFITGEAAGQVCDDTQSTCRTGSIL